MAGGAAVATFTQLASAASATQTRRWCLNMLAPPFQSSV
jgi:hypothetical protein